MKLLIFGATGATGKLIADYALDYQHEITLYVRNPEKLHDNLKQRENIRVVSGTLDDLDALSRAIQGQDAVLSALGPSIFFGSKGMIPKGYRNILSQMKVHGVTRIIALNTPDLYHPQDKPSFLRTMAYYLITVVARSTQLELQEVGRIFETEGLADGIDWTLYRVATLFDSDHDQEIRADWVGVPDYGLSLNRRDCARWVVEEVEKGKQSEWIGGMPALWSTGKAIT
ncbi:hypothetical protein FQN57_004378 [Myotisia sp. PD_48]|nr:hypothetical protein FQN57_004378 [Myotisia sp. PD_48]